MLPSVQTFTTARPELFRRFHGAFHPRIWVHIVEQTGCLDEALVRNLGAERPGAGRRLIGIVLGGESHARFRDQTIRVASGAGIACEGRGLFLGRAESRGDEASLSVNIDYDAAYFGSARLGSPKSFALSHAPRVRLEVVQLQRVIEKAWRDASYTGLILEQLSVLLALLAADGLDVPRLAAPDLATDLAPEIHTVSRALDLSLSQTDDMPMLVDLEAATGLSTRTVQRVLPRVTSAWGHAGKGEDGFRVLRGRAQLVRACLVMSHPSATTERAAELLRFSSPNALCRAFMKRGMPTPGSVRARLRDLQAL